MTSAYLGRIDGPTRVAFWTEEPASHGYDHAQLIEIDLARTPHAALAGEIPWDAIDVDDAAGTPGGELGGTTLGPRWPEIQIAAAASLERSFIARLPAQRRPAVPPTNMGGRAYEYELVLYWPNGPDPRAGKRYAGHHAEIIDERGTLARVKVYPPGDSDQPHARTSMMWIDLAAPDQCDAGPNALTQIGTGDAPKQGALFLIAGEMRA